MPGRFAHLSASLNVSTETSVVGIESCGCPSIVLPIGVVWDEILRLLMAQCCRHLGLLTVAAQVFECVELVVTFLLIMINEKRVCIMEGNSYYYLSLFDHVKTL